MVTTAIPIPKVGTELPQSSIQRTAEHPEFTASWLWYRFLRESHEMSGAYAPVVDSYDTPKYSVTRLLSYLVPHEREDADQFQWRIRRARAPKFLAKGIAVTSGVLTFQKPRRDGMPKRLEQWLRWVNPKGQDWRSYVATDIVPMLERYSWLLVLISPPPIGGRTEAEQKAAREKAQLPELTASVISPEAIRAWERDDLGRYTWLRYVEAVYLPGGPLDGGGRRIHRHWWLTRSGWWYADDLMGTADIEARYPTRTDPEASDGSAPVQGEQVTDSIVAAVRHEREGKLLVGGSGYWQPDHSELASVPVATWELPGRVSPSHDCAMAQLDYYRTESELKTIEAATAFSQTWVPTIGGSRDPTSMVRGASTIGTFPSESHHVPMVLSPDAGPFAHFSGRLVRLSSEAYDAWGLQQDLSGSGTGIALSLIQDRATNLYRQHSTSLTQGDTECMEIAATLLGEDLSDEYVCEYPSDFSPLTAEAVIANVETFLGLDVGEFFERRAKVEAARVVLPQLTEAEIEEGEKAIEEREAEKEAQAAEWNDKALEAEGGMFGGDDEKKKPPPALDPSRARGKGGAERLAGRQG